MSSYRPRVGFHMFETYKKHPGKDGANLAYSELAKHVQSWDELESRPHDFTQICKSDDLARVLGRSACGPAANTKVLRLP